VNITSPEFHANPFAYYELLRDEAPVHPVTLPDKRQAWLVTRYDDVNALLRDARFVKSIQNVPRAPGEPPVKQQWMPAFAKPLQQTMLDLDGADHDRLRRLAHHAFTPKLVEQLRDQVQSITDQLIDRALAKGRMDARQDFALPLPVTIIAALLGVPAEDHDKFHRWSSALIGSASSIDVLLSLPSLWQFVRYVRGLIAMKRKQPSDDLTTALLQANEGGAALSDDETVAMIVLLLIAGHETTVSLISSGVLALLQHPEQLARLRSDPALMKGAIEELLRLTSPIAIATERYATEDVTIAGAAIPRGALTLGVLLSANHDERQFEQPDALDITRQNNRHLAFGQGAHYCLGAPLARLEAHVAFSTLLARAPNLRLAVPANRVKWCKSLVVRSIESLPVLLQPR
jgi:cytochrome P450 PksS